ncbi:MAG: RNA polymerase sigma factor RpoE [Anaerolineae bacterium]|jgi:RNA polymerase sigma-70 factor (ECF subfamily)|nr:MAG: RNA polymerase sigma factor RpoE [Anaerolineae bacterium]
MDEETAIQQLKRGDLQGLEFLVLRYQIKALRVANLITRDLPLAEDVVQECFLRLIRTIHTFDCSRPFEPWFLRSVVHAASRAAQRTNRYVYAVSEAEEEWFETLFGNTPSAETEMEFSEIQQQVLDALQKLSPRQRAVLVQRYYLGWSEKEMVAELGVKPGTVKWLLNAARNRLRAILMKGGQDER